MSEPVFEASVRIHADTSTVEREASQGIKTSLDKAEQQAQTRVSGFEQRAAQRAQQQAALDARNAAERARRDAEYQARRRQQEAELARLQPSVDLQMQSQIAATRSSTAGLVGDEAGRRKFELESVVKGTQAASLTMKRNSEDLMKAAAAATGYERELLLANAQNSVVAAEKLRLEAARLQLEGLPQEEVAGGRREGLLRGLLGGRESGLAGLVGGAARFGLAGFAFTSALQGLSSLQEKLKTTGADALTTEGRLRNVGAALAGGNLFGAIGALTRQAETVDDLGITVQNAAPKLAALQRISQGTAQAELDSARATQQHNEAVRGGVVVYGRGAVAAEQSGAATLKYKDAVEGAGTANRELAAAGAEAAQAILDQNAAMQQLLLTATQFRDAQGNIILNPFGGIAPPPTVPPQNFSQQPGVVVELGPQTFGKLQNELQAAQRAGDLQAASSIAGRLVGIAQFRLGAAQEAADRPGLSPARQTFLRGLIQRRGQELQAALNQQDSINDQITAANKSASEAAKAERERQASERERAAAAKVAADAEKASAVQAGLENQIAKAALTKRKSDDIAAFNVAINYWRDLGKAAKNATDREDAESHVIALRKRLQELLSGKNPAAAAGEDIRLLRIQNNIQAAQLTAGLGDDKRWADALVRYWQEQFKQADGIDKERARTSLIAAKLARKQLTAGQEVEKATTTVFDLLSRTSDSFSRFSGNLINSRNPFSRESFVGEQAQFFRPGLTGADQLLAGPTGFTASLDNFRNRAARIPGSGLEGSLDANTTATDRLTDAILNGPIARNDKRYGATYGEVQGARWTAVGDFWKARQARQAAEAGVGAAGAGF